MPIYETDSSEELKPYIGQIVELCVGVVSDDARTLAFVKELRSTAASGALAEWGAGSGGPLSETGWSQLGRSLDAAFPDGSLTSEED